MVRKRPQEMLGSLDGSGLPHCGGGGGSVENQISRRVPAHDREESAVGHGALTNCLTLAVENIGEVSEEPGGQNGRISHLQG
jgi:hypothetical protein